MKNMVKVMTQFLKLILLLLIFSNSNRVSAQDVQDKLKKPETKTEDVQKVEALTLSELIPEASLLAEKSTVLEYSIGNLIDDEFINKIYKKTTDGLKNVEVNFKLLIKEESFSTNELDNVKGELEQLGQSFNEANKKLTSAIETLEKSRIEWLQYKSKWATYETLLLEQEVPEEVKITLKNAHDTIEKGLAIVIKELNILMKLQQNGYTNQSKINDLNNQILLLRQKKIVTAFEDGSIPMYSPKFFAQFDNKLWFKIKRGFNKVILPNISFLQNILVMHFFQIVITLLVIYLIRKNKSFLKSKKEFEYVINRSISAGLFFGAISVFMFQIDSKSPPIWSWLFFILSGFSFCRLISSRNIQVWKKQFVYVLVSVITVTGFFHVFNIPVVLFRLFVLIVASIGIYQLYWWKKKNRLTAKAKKYTWLFNLLIVYLCIVVVTEILGKEVLALYMYEALLKTFMILVFTYVFIKMIKVGVEGGLKFVLKENSNISEELIDKTVNRITILASILIILLGLIPRLLVFWNVHNNNAEAFDKLISIGFQIGKTNVSIGVIITAICIFYGSYILSTLVEMFLMNDNFDKKLDKGARLSIGQLVRYFLLFFGFLIAIASIGFDLTNLTIVLSALSVGIGFGLQGLVNNFVSGLILLFERPIREGDTIEVEGLWSDVKKIGLRSTTVQSFDQSDIIIPNADLVYNKVTNWTLTNQRKRLKISVGVAYGSDVALVIETLKEIGSTNTDLVKNHKPVVLFVDFADSTLNFELRVWAKDANLSMQIESDLRQEIDKRFRENNIEIAFPQRDLHIRSVDASISGLTVSEKK